MLRKPKNEKEASYLRKIDQNILKAKMYVSESCLHSMRYRGMRASSFLIEMGVMRGDIQEAKKIYNDDIDFCVKHKNKK